MRPLISSIVILCGTIVSAAPPPLGTAVKVLSPRFFPGWQSQNVIYPFVVNDTVPGSYRMFYAGSASEQWNDSVAEQWVTGCVTSTDTLSWKYPENYEQVLFARKLYEVDAVDPVQMAAVFDSMYATGACVLLDGGQWKVWYTGWNGETEAVGGGITKKVKFRIGYATSSDAVHWTKTQGSAGAGSVLSVGTSGGAESKGVAAPHVLKEGALYRMWYEGYDGQTWRLFYATSSDGIAWTRVGQALGPGGNGSKDQLGLRNPLVIRRSNRFELWYQGQSQAAPNYHVLRATSTDGITWAKVSQEVTLHATPAPTGSENILVDSAIVQSDQSVQIFYAQQSTTSQVLTNGTLTNRNYYIYTELVNP